MYCVRKVVDDLYWVGGNDHRLALFENIHPIPNGVSYNSYLLLDKKTVLFDTVDWDACRQFLENVEHVLNGRDLDYLVINHMEPDHGASIEEILLRYPKVKIISTEKSFLLMHQFGFNVDGRTEEVKEGDTRCFGKHTITFVEAPMVHWPEAMVSFDVTNGVLFSADAFGSFGALDGKLFNDEVDFDRDWLDDARRYYTNIVGKYGMQVQNVLKKASTLDIRIICPLHGPIWRNNLAYLLEKYDIWSSYRPEVKGVMIAYASMYGNTENLANVLACKLADAGITNLTVHDVSRSDVSELIADSFKYSHIVLASPTYNGGVYPAMSNLLEDMNALGIKNRTVAVLGNGTWAPTSAKLMEARLAEMKGMTLLTENFAVKSALQDDQLEDLDELCAKITETLTD